MSVALYLFVCDVGFCRSLASRLGTGPNPHRLGLHGEDRPEEEDGRKDEERSLVQPPDEREEQAL